MSSKFEVGDLTTRVSLAGLTPEQLLSLPEIEKDNYGMPPRYEGQNPIGVLDTEGQLYTFVITKSGWRRKKACLY